MHTEIQVVDPPPHVIPQSPRTQFSYSCEHCDFKRIRDGFDNGEKAEVIKHERSHVFAEPAIAIDFVNERV